MSDTPATTPSPIGSPNTSTDETLKVVSLVGSLLGQFAPLADGIAVLSGADVEDVKAGTTAALQAIPAIEGLIASFIKIFG